MLKKRELAVITRLFASQIGFGLEASVAADMFDGYAVIAQNAPDEQPAVAAGRIFFHCTGGRPGNRRVLSPVEQGPP